MITKFRLYENQNKGEDVICYHGTRSFIPFQSFEELMIGSGIVSTGNKKYGGFFFTTESENAEFYTEWFIITVKIFNVKPNPTDSKHSPTVLKTAISDNEIYKIDDILDGSYVSDIIVVPSSLLENIQILEWEFVGDEESLFQRYDEAFGSDGEVSKDMIDESLEIMNLDLNYLLSIPIFKKYYDSK